MRLNQLKTDTKQSSISDESEKCNYLSKLKAKPDEKSKKTLRQ